MSDIRMSNHWTIPHQDSREAQSSEAAQWPLYRTPLEATPADVAIDAALRSVPMPEGLLARLSTRFDAPAEETADAVDSLGC